MGAHHRETHNSSPCADSVFSRVPRSSTSVLAFESILATPVVNNVHRKSKSWLRILSHWAIILARLCVSVYQNGIWALRLARCWWSFKYGTRDNTALQSPKGVSCYFTIKQILPIGFTGLVFYCFTTQWSFSIYLRSDRLRVWRHDFTCITCQLHELWILCGGSNIKDHRVHFMGIITLPTPV